MHQLAQQTYYELGSQGAGRSGPSVAVNADCPKQPTDDGRQDSKPAEKSASQIKAQREGNGLGCFAYSAYSACSELCFISNET